jgi:hypothetical protein
MKRKDIKKLPKEVQALPGVPSTKPKRSFDFSESAKKLGFKTLENMASVKFYILVVSTVFFYVGKLSEGVWQETVLIVAGLRAVNEVASMFKKEPAGEASAKVEADKENGDNGKK